MAKYLIVGTDLRRERLYREGEVIDLDPREAAKKTCLVPFDEIEPVEEAPEVSDAGTALDMAIGEVLEDVTIPDPDLDGIFSDIAEIVGEGALEAVHEEAAPPPREAPESIKPLVAVPKKKSKAPKRRGKHR